jgi:hypothetical protein
MTPVHAKLVDDLLQQFFERANEQIHVCGFYLKGGPPNPEKLRSGPIGQHLVAIAEYGEGHSYLLEREDQDIRTSIAIVKRAFLGDVLSKEYRLPPKFHQTPLGNMINDALLRFYQEQGQLLAIGTLRERFGVKRQTIHLWIEEGRITPAYLSNGETRFFLPDVERLEENRAPKNSSD